MHPLIFELTDKDDSFAYAKTKEVASASEASPEYYPLLDDFASLLDDKKSYVRTRAFILCCCQARWDNEGKLSEIFPKMINLLHDDKPTVVRQCLNAVKEIIVFRPELRNMVRNEISSIDLSKYKDSMVPLLMKDIGEVSELLDEESGI